MQNEFEIVFNRQSGFQKVDLASLSEDLGKSEILVRPRYVGICGSDLYLLNLPLDNLRLGHEWVGQVVQIGSQVSSFKVGDWVSGTGHFACGKCADCLDEKSNLCSKAVHFSSHQVGALRSSFKAPSDQVFKIETPIHPGHALLEVFAVGEQAYNQLTPFLNSQSKIIVFGAGPIGLSVCLVLKSYNFEVILIEKQTFRIQKARELGLNAISLQEAILTPELKSKFSVAIDCTNDYSGDNGAFKWLSYFSKKEFVALIVGKYLKPQEIPSQFNSMAAQLIWMRGVANSILKKTISKWEHLLSSYYPLIVTHTFSTYQIDEAFLMAADKANSIKVLIDLNS